MERAEAGEETGHLYTEQDARRQVGVRERCVSLAEHQNGRQS